MTEVMKECLLEFKNAVPFMAQLLLALLENKLLIGLSNANIRFSRNGSEMHIPGNLASVVSLFGHTGNLSPLGH